MKPFVFPVIVVVMLSLVGYAGMTETQQRTVTGGAAGAASDAGLGAAIGGGAGLLD